MIEPSLPRQSVKLPAVRLPQPGAGTRLITNGLGTIIGAPTWASHFPHPWHPYLGRDRLKLSSGRIENIEPKIDGKSMEEGLLRLEPKVANDRGESWACLEVEPAESGELTKDSRIEIVHSRVPSSLDPQLGRCPLVLILWKDKSPLRALPIAMFHLRYARVNPPDGEGATRHLFF